jgi:hypothetical protein
MCEEQVFTTNDAQIARSAMWLTCPDCDHTTRVLAVMAGRVLRERRHCPNCLSMRAPLMNQTPVGAHIPASEAHHAPGSAEETAYLVAWLERVGDKKPDQRWFAVFLHHMATRFSRSRPAHAETRLLPPLHEPGFQLATPKDKL